LDGRSEELRVGGGVARAGARTDSEELDAKTGDEGGIKQGKRKGCKIVYPKTDIICPSVDFNLSDVRVE
jgi:hypothetical protein